jgi:hypothetical protein
VRRLSKTRLLAAGSYGFPRRRKFKSYLEELSHLPLSSFLDIRLRKLPPRSDRAVRHRIEKHPRIT